MIAYIKLKTPDTACSNPVFRAVTSISGVFGVEPQQSSSAIRLRSKHIRGFMGWNLVNLASAFESFM